MTGKDLNQFYNDLELFPIDGNYVYSEYYYDDDYYVKYF